MKRIIQSQSMIYAVLFHVDHVYVSRDVKALQPEGQFRAGAPDCHPEALYHVWMPAGIFGLFDQQHWQGTDNRGQAAARFISLIAHVLFVICNA